MKHSNAIYIDISRLLDRALAGQLATGVDRVLLAYANHYQNRAQAIVRFRSWRRLLDSKSSQALFNVLLQRDLARPTAHIFNILARACIPPWPSQDAQGAFSFYVAHSGWEGGALGRWLRQSHQSAIAFLHDVIPVTHPEYARPGIDQLHLARLQGMVRDARGMVVNSQATLSALEQQAELLRLKLPPVLVAHLGTTPLPLDILHKESDRSFPSCYFVMVGTIEPRKNHLTILNAWRQMAQVLGPDCPHLYILGRRGWECENVVDMLERCPGLRGVVHEVADCPDQALRRYIQGARALLFPSFTEGYGMPIVEALSCGTPVICSDLAVYQEIAPGIPEVLSPIDGLGWLDAVIDFAQADSPRRQSQLGRLKGWSPPTWRQHFDEVEAFIQGLADA